MFKYLPNLSLELERLIKDLQKIHGRGYFVCVCFFFDAFMGYRNVTLV